MTYRDEFVYLFVHLANLDVKDFTMEVVGRRLIIINKLLADIFQIPDTTGTHELKDMKESKKKIRDSIILGKKNKCLHQILNCGTSLEPRTIGMHGFLSLIPIVA